MYNVFVTNVEDVFDENGYLDIEMDAPNHTIKNIGTCEGIPVMIKDSIDVAKFTRNYDYIGFAGVMPAFVFIDMVESKVSEIFKEDQLINNLSVLTQELPQVIKNTFKLAINVIDFNRDNKDKECTILFIPIGSEVSVSRKEYENISTIDPEPKCYTDPIEPGEDVHLGYPYEAETAQEDK